MTKFKPDKLRVNLKLVINRLKLLEKKKTEQALKARKEIADYIKSGRIERARIRVEHIIREDYLVEAMEVIELYCDLLLARFGMLGAMSYCEDSLSEPVSTLLWVAPRLSAEIQELAVVSDQLSAKFGKPFAEQARANLSGTVNAKVIHRLGIEAPKKSLVENYLVEIARNYRVEYEPDPSALMDEDILSPESFHDDRSYYGGGGGGEGGYVPAAAPQPAYNPPPQQQPATLPVKVMPNDAAPPYSAEIPPSHTSLPYPAGGPTAGVQPPPLPPTAPTAAPGGLDLPPVPTVGFPSATAGSDAGGEVDFDDLTRRFEELKRRR